MKPWFDIPIYHWHAGRLSCIYVRQYIESAQKQFPQARRLTRAQVEAMDLMDELCNDPEIHLAMDFRPGDMQLLHNHQILHSRGDFENWPEPERHRHLLRLWLRRRRRDRCPRSSRRATAAQCLASRRHRGEGHATEGAARSGIGIRPFFQKKGPDTFSRV